ncbi:type 2 lantibiotic biosynthesis protein LanM [Amorphus suaedae]
MQRDEFAGLIASRTETLDNRLTAEAPSRIPDADALAVADRRLDRWRAHLTRFDAHGFDRRLRLSCYDLSIGELRHRLAPRAQSDDRGAPSPWIAEAWDLAGHLSIAPSDHLHDDADPVPFEDLFSGLAERERRRLWAECPDAARLLCPASGNALARGLVGELSALLADCLEHEFSRFRLLYQTDRQPTSRTGYRAFLDLLRESQAHSFLVKYAAATQAAVEALAQWRRNQRDLLLRFASDRQAIGRAFGWDPDDLRVEGVAFGRSDRHNGGAQVHRLDLPGGRSLYYKPRALGIETAVGELVATFGRDGPAILPPMVDRGGYGWSLAVPPGPAEFADYYASAGRTLAIAWILGATDLHDENVVPGPDGPVIVDAETFASPVPRLFSSRPEDILSSAEQETVLRTGLLHRRFAYADGTPVQTNGFARGAIGPTRVRARRFVNVNTDAMAVAECDAALDADTGYSLPPHDPGRYAETIASAFEAACERFRFPEPDELASVLKQAFARRQIRVIVRDTNAYASLLRRLRLPQHSLMTIDAEIEVESLAATLVASDATQELWPLFLKEKADLLRGDIPYFSVPAEETVWRNDSGDETRLYARSGVDRISDTIASLDREAIEIQCSLIRASFRGSRPWPQPNPAGSSLLSQKDAVAEASRIADLLLAAARRTRDGDGRDVLSWFATRLSPGGSEARVAATTPDLYDGRAGIGLFLAALAFVRSDSRYRAAALGALRPLCAGPIAPMGRTGGLHGGCVGPPSIAYALHQAGRLLADEAIETAGRAWARAATGGLRSNGRPDWIDGLAGEAIALLPFRDLLPGGWADAVLSRLAGCEMTQAGAGHGIAGVRHALHRLGGRFERSSDVPPPSIDTVGWAHGREGIVIMAQRTDDPAPSLSAMFDAIATDTASDWDTLSSGMAARIEMWLTVGDERRAREAAFAICDRAAREGGYRVPGGGIPNPGLFDGLAGIGYSLLRLDHRTALPSVLLLEDADAPL